MRTSMRLGLAKGNQAAGETCRCSTSRLCYVVGRCKDGTGTTANAAVRRYGGDGEAPPCNLDESIVLNRSSHDFRAFATS